MLDISNIITQNEKKDNYSTVNQAVPRIRIYPTDTILQEIKGMKYLR